MRVAALIAFVALTAGWTLEPDPRTSCQLPPVSREPGKVLVYLVRTDAPSVETVAASRSVSAAEAEAPLKAALVRLLSGVTRDERLAGCGSTFRDDAHVLRSVTLEDGQATIDFRRGPFLRELAIVSASSAGTYFGGQIAKTVFQFPSVRSIRFEFDGNCKAFGDFMQAGVCIVVPRERAG